MDDYCRKVAFNFEPVVSIAGFYCYNLHIGPLPEFVVAAEIRADLEAITVMNLLNVCCTLPNDLDQNLHNHQH